VLREQTTQSTRGFCTAGFFPYFFSKSLKASMARALRVVSCSAASIRRALHPSAFILVMIPLNASGSRAFFPVFACAKMPPTFNHALKRYSATVQSPNQAILLA